MSDLPEIHMLRRTLMRWRFEVLTYFASGLTSGRTEGFNSGPNERTAQPNWRLGQDRLRRTISGRPRRWLLQ